ncbi:MAG TPA: metal-dependent transcriptional regulator [Phycisphaerae bacterium]|nr:metal-dependent transcriptional regulator [Phycisphaerae bacterium]
MAAKKLSASLEDYLEAIFQIASKKQAARSIDISRLAHVSKSSVTGALRALADKGLINYAPYDLVTLTPEGKVVAEDVVRRHEVLGDFFVHVLGVDEKQAEAAACKMEHAMSEEILERFVRFVALLETGASEVARRLSEPGGGFEEKTDGGEDAG